MWEEVDFTHSVFLHKMHSLWKMMSLRLWEGLLSSGHDSIPFFISAWNFMHGSWKKYSFIIKALQTTLFNRKRSYLASPNNSNIMTLACLLETGSSPNKCLSDRNGMDKGSLVIFHGDTSNLKHCLTCYKYSICKRVSFIILVMVTVNITTTTMVIS